MRTERLGWPAIVALATLLFLGVWSRQQVTPVAAAVFATIGAVGLAWVLDIILSALTYYRTGTQPKSFFEVVRRHTSLRTPPAATVVRNLLVAVAGVAVVSATVGTGIGAIDTATPAVGGNVSAGGVVSGITSTGEDEINETQIERAMHQRINEIRDERGVRPLVYSDQVADSADAHSEWMARELELKHSTLETQYACQEVGENIAYTYASEDVITENGTVNYYGNETAIAHGLVRQWMHSPPHRENLLDPSFSGEGIGVANNSSADGQRVYATQALCG